MSDLTPIVTLVDNTPRVSSLDIAERFGKSHDQVLKVIRRIMPDCPAEFNAVNFDAVEYTDAKGESRPAYSLTRDAFSLVAMGFTGKAALAWKVRYIEAFNAMEKELIKQPTKPAPVAVEDEVTRARRLTCERKRRQREREKVGGQKRLALPVAKVDPAFAIMEKIEAVRVRNQDDMSLLFKEAMEHLDMNKVGVKIYLGFCDIVFQWLREAVVSATSLTANDITNRDEKIRLMLNIQQRISI